VVLALYISAVGLSAGTIGLRSTLTLAGDAGITLLLTTSADRFGRRRTLLVGAAISPSLAGLFLGSPAPLSVPLILSGG